MKVKQRLEVYLQKKKGPYALRPEKWCCMGFKDMFESRHREGLFIFATPSTRQSCEAQFWIGMRAIPLQDFKRVSILTQDPPVRIVLATRTPVTYCPWCGSHLARYYLSHLAQIIDHDLIREFMLESPSGVERTKENEEGEPNQAL